MSETAFYRLLKDGKGPYGHLNQFISARNSSEKYYKAQRVSRMWRGRSKQS
jgi:hypothetical protein